MRAVIRLSHEPLSLPDAFITDLLCATSDSLHIGSSHNPKRTIHSLQLPYLTG